MSEPPNVLSVVPRTDVLAGEEPGRAPTTLRHAALAMYRWVEHTGELEVWIEASTKAAIFVDAAAALAETFGAIRRGAPMVRREVSVVAPDDEALLVAWLNELLYLAETEDLRPQRVAALQLAGGSLQAEVEGRVSPARSLVKAITFHRLQVAEQDGRWYARVVLDV
jgi:protein archease